MADRSAAAADTPSSVAKEYNPDGHLPGPGPELPEPAALTAAAPASARSWDSQTPALGVSGPGPALGGAAVVVGDAGAFESKHASASAWLRSAAAAAAAAVTFVVTAAVAPKLQRSAANWGAGAGHSRWRWA